MKYTNVTQPKYADPTEKKINCWVKFEEFKNNVPFTASADDCEEHGKKIYQELKSGKYGQIEPYEA